MQCCDDSKGQEILPFFLLIGGEEMKTRPHHQRIGQILIHLGASDEKHVSEARLVQMKNTVLRRLGEIMIEYGHITEDDLERALSVQRDLDSVATEG